MKKIVALLLVVLCLAAGTFFYVKRNDNAVKYRSVPVVTGSLRATVTATGTMNAVTTVLVGTQVSGMIKKLHVDFNSRVKQGEIIAEIDPSAFQAQVDQATANLLQAKATVAKSTATFGDSRRIRNRNRELFARSLIARADVETAEANHDAIDAQVRADTAQVAQMEAALRLAETNLRYTKIVSPVDGVVVSRSVDVGQTVAASFQTPTLFTIAQDLTKMQIDTNVDEADIGKIQIGQGAEFNVDAFPDNTFRGIVHQIRIAPITVQNVVTYDVVIKVDNTDLRLKPGMTANVSVVVATKDRVVKIPNAALRFRPTEKDVAPLPLASVDSSAGRPSAPPTGRMGGGTGQGQGKPSPRVAGPRGYAVWILENGKPKRCTVTIGISDGAFTEVTSGELKEGQEVITESSLSKPQKNSTGSQSMPRFIR
jgi:HlyD family secretion protein